VEGSSLDLKQRVEAWPRAAIRVVETPGGFVHIHLVVTGSANVEQFDREGRWLDSEFVRWKERGRQGLEDRDLADVLLAFGVPDAEAAAIAADMRAGAEPLVGSDESWWKNVGLWLGSFAFFLSGWILAVVLAIVLLVLVLT
jgi:hypothetical protein